MRHVILSKSVSECNIPYHEYIFMFNFYEIYYMPDSSPMHIYHMYLAYVLSYACRRKQFSLLFHIIYLTGELNNEHVTF